MTDERAIERLDAVAADGAGDPAGWLDDVQITSTGGYTEAHHKAYGDVAGAEQVRLGSGERDILPERITVHYEWRVHLGHTGWLVSRIELSGPWVTPEGKEPRTGRGVVLLGMSNAPAWAKRFAEEHAPTMRLVERAEGVSVEQAAEAIKAGEWRLQDGQRRLPPAVEGQG